MIEVENLWRSYGRFTALKGLSFAIEPGQIVGFLGPNGAGKTTAMRILTTYLPPGAGTVRVAGIDVTKRPREVCRKVGYLPEEMPTYPEMRVLEYLRYRSVLRAVPRRRVSSRIDEVTEVCGLRDVKKKQLGALSKGYRQRLGLADALLHDPEVLILDEPTVGLDPRQVVEVRRLIANFRGKRTVLLSSHILGEVEQVCDQIVIIAAGQIRARETHDGWRKRLESEGKIRVGFLDEPDDARTCLREIPGVRTVEKDGSGFVLRADRDVRHDVFQLAKGRDWKLNELRRIEPSLESLFLAVTDAAALGEGRPDRKGR